jgi:thiamine-monophosphate kinase
MPRSPSRSPRLSERGFITALQAAAEQRVRPRQLRTGIGDDCAILRVPPGHELAVTTDLSLETVHFRRDWHSPESAGHRCLARGLSDLAAMGAQPLAAFLSIALPSSLVGAWSTRFLDGLLALARAANIPLAGGDTAQAPRTQATDGLVSADILLLGSVPSGTALLRSGARTGDLLYVTGALGGAAAQLAWLKTQPAGKRKPRKAVPSQPQLFPQPRIAQGLRLRSLATACIDLSDGLSTDLAHLCASSGLIAQIDAGAIPLHPLALAQSNALELALHGGEDYELLFTAAATTHVPRSIAGVPLRPIGRMLRPRKGQPVIALVAPDGQRSPLGNEGWEHFRTTP